MAKIFVRADSSSRIGTGHIMRCLAFGERARQEGYELTFIGREHPGHLLDEVEGKGHDVHRLPLSSGSLKNSKPSALSHGDWLGTDWETDRDQVAAILSREGQKPDWLIVDHYALDAEWEKSLRPLVQKVFVIDDLADRAHDCDLLLDQNFTLNDKRYDGLVPEGASRLLGPRFAFLRKEFQLEGLPLRGYEKGIRKIFVFFGGDHSNETLKTLQAIHSLGRSELSVQVVLGPTYAFRDSLDEGWIQKGPYEILTNVKNMAERMLQADLGIGAGGTSLWERCAVGLPSLVTSVSENQIPASVDLDRAGYATYLGKSEDVTQDMIASRLKALIDDPSPLREIAQEKLKGWVDGRGVEKCLKKMAELQRMGSGSR